MEGKLNNDNSSSSTNWRPSTQMESGRSATNNSEMEVDPHWRNAFPVVSREKIISKLMSTLQKHSPINAKGMGEQNLKSIALRFEDKIYSTATSKEDYMRTICSTLKTTQIKNQGCGINSLPDNSTGCDQKLLDSATDFTQPIQIQARPQLLTENNQSSITQSSAGFVSALSTIPGSSQVGISTVGGQTNDMSIMSRISQNSLNNSRGQVLSQNTLLTNSPRYQMQARQPQQQQKRAQTQHHLIYQQQSQNLQQQSHLQPSVQQQSQPQHSFLEQKSQQEPPAHVQSPEQPMVQAAQLPILQSAQQAGHQQTAVWQPTNQSVQQSQHSTGQTVPLFALHQHQQPVCRQQQSVPYSVTQQQQATCQQPVLHSQHQHMGKQNNVANKQQKHHLQQIFQHPNSGNIHQTMQASQASLQPQSQESQQQLQKHQQLRSQLQSESQQLQQQSLLQQPHSNQQEVQHSLQTCDSLLQQQNNPEPYCQPSQQRASIDSSGQTGWRTVDVEDWQEKMYQKLQYLKEAYNLQLEELHNYLMNMSQQPLGPVKLERFEKIRKSVERILRLLHVSKSGIPKRLDDNMVLALENQMKAFLNMLKSTRSASQQHEGQQHLQLQTSSKVQSVQQSSQPQISHIQQLDKNVFQQQLSSQASLVPIQHESAPILPQAASMALQKNRLNSLPPNSNAFQQQKQALVQKQDHQKHEGQQHLQLQTSSKVQSVQQSSQPQISHIQQLDKNVLQQQQLSSQASLVPIQHGSAPILPQAASMALQKNRLNSLPPNSNAFQQPKQALVQSQDHQQHEGQQHLQLQTSSKVQSVQRSSQPQISHNQQLDKNVLQQQLSSQASLVPIQHGSAPILPQAASMALQKNRLNSLPTNSNAFQQQKQALVQKQDHPQHLIQPKKLKDVQHGQKQHPSFQQQQQQMQHSLFRQHQQKKHQVAQRAQINTQKTAQSQLRSDINSEVKAKLTAAFKPASVQHQQLGQLSVSQQQPQEQQDQQYNEASSLSASSPYLLPASSPQISQHFTPQIDKQSLMTSSLQFSKIGTPVQAATPCVASSPSTLPTASTLLENVDTKSASVVSSVSNTGSAQGLQQSVTTSANTQSLTIGTPGISASPLLGTSSPNVAQDRVSQDGYQTISPGLMMGEKQTTEAPMQSLVKMIRLMSPETFKSAVTDMRAVVRLSDSVAGSAPARRSKASVGEDLVAMTRCHLQESNLMSLDSGAAAKKVRRCVSSLPLINASSGGSLDDTRWITDVESSKMLSTATSTAKRPRLELDRVLQLEIRDVNEHLIETVVDVSDDDIDAASCEGRDGIVVKCSYNAMAFGRRMNSGYKHTHKSPISPLWLLIPLSYPKCSPVVLNRLPVETIKEHEDLSSKAKAMFDVSVRNFPEPMTLETLVRTWDDCARNVVAEYAYQRGGGNFSSQYGTWEYCIRA